MAKDVRNFSCGHHLRSPSIFVPRWHSKNKAHSGTMGTRPNAGCQLTRCSPDRPIGTRKAAPRSTVGQSERVSGRGRQVQGATRPQSGGDSRWADQVGDDETHPRVQLALVPLDLGHHAPGLGPALSLVGEARVQHARLLRQAADGSGQQVADPLLQDQVGRQADRVADALGFQQVVELGLGERCVATQVEDQPRPR